MTEHSLTLGSLLLTDSLPDGDDGFVFNTLAEGAGFGVAKGAREVVVSLLADGDLTRITRYGNREVSFQVNITGPSLAALAQGEAALRREVGRGNVLTWQPPDVLSAPTVFEVITSEMEQKFDDLDELRTSRTYTLTLTCSPFARSVDAVVVDAMVSGTTTVTVDTCDSVTGWTGTRGGVASPADGPFTGWEAGSVGIMELSNTVGFPPETWTLTRTGSVDFTSTRFLDVELTTLSAKGGAPLKVSGHLNGSTTPLPIMQVRKITDGSGYFRVTFDTGGVVSSSITFKHTSAPGYGHAWQGLQVRNIARTNVVPSINARQLTRIIAGAGTERAPGSIQVTAASVLGHTIVHTCPEDGSGYSPPLRRWRVSGNGTPTVEAARFSGAYEPTEPNAFIAQVPNSSLPSGDYLLVARLYSTAAATVKVNYAAGTIVNSQPQGQELGSESVDFAGAGWRTFPIAVLSLPTVRSLGPVTQIDIQTFTSDSVTTQIDEAWLFRMGEDCGLTIVSNPTKNLWLDSPDSTSGVPRVWIGDISDRSDARHPAAGLESFGTHVIHPDGTALFTAAEVDYPAASGWFYPRWHSNAAS